MSNYLFMQRAFDLAQMGANYANPNPTVGAVIVHNNKIIGEGYHQKYGEAHAEVNAVASIAKQDRPLLKESSIYVSLEPCCIHGNTPPCTDLIIRHQIPKVYISNIDDTPKVQGASLNILRAKGIEVFTKISLDKGKEVSTIRNTFVGKKRPYIIIKFAQSADGFIGKEKEQIWLTNPVSKRLVHKWRSEADAIMVGTNTAKIDNPQLTNRLYGEKSPLRIVLDRQLRLPNSIHLLDDQFPTWVITEQQHSTSLKNTQYQNIKFDKNLIPNILMELHKSKKAVLIVEGGKQLIETFLDLNLWDEVRVFQTNKTLKEGITAPKMTGQQFTSYPILNDILKVYKSNS